MNHWLLIRRSRGPAFLILLGITALLNQWGVLGFSRSWPLYLILAGVLMLAERAAMTSWPIGTAPPQTNAGVIFPNLTKPQPDPAPQSNPQSHASIHNGEEPISGESRGA